MYLKYLIVFPSLGYQGLQFINKIWYGFRLYDNLLTTNHYNQIIIYKFHITNKSFKFPDIPA